jgi:hypothetical protein
METAAITIPEQRQGLLRSINLSLGVGILMLLLKFTAYWFTRSSAILSDASESIVHVGPSPPPLRVSDVARVRKIAVGDQSSRNKRTRMPNRPGGPWLRSAHPSREGCG